MLPRNQQSQGDHLRQDSSTNKASEFNVLTEKINTKQQQANVNLTENNALSQAILPVDVSETGRFAESLLKLNNDHAEELSWLEPEQFRHLVAQAFTAKRIGDAEALLLAFDQDADYKSPNFLWFRSRYPRFVYVDRIVVASSS